MSKTQAFLLALAALLVGAVAGGWGVSKFWGHLAGDFMTNSMAAEVGTFSSIRKCLRAGSFFQ